MVTSKIMRLFKPKYKPGEDVIYRDDRGLRWKMSVEYSVEDVMFGLIPRCYYRIVGEIDGIRTTVKDVSQRRLSKLKNSLNLSQLFLSGFQILNLNFPFFYFFFTNKNSFAKSFRISIF